MIINGMKMVFINSVQSALAGAFVLGSVALVVGAAAAPAIAAGAIVAATLVASNTMIGLIRERIFVNRVQELERYAVLRGLDPKTIVVQSTTDQRGDNFAFEHPRSLASLSGDKELSEWAINGPGVITGHYRISREATENAKHHMRSLARDARNAAGVPPQTKFNSVWSAAVSNALKQGQTPAVASVTNRSKTVETLPKSTPDVEATRRPKPR